MKKSQSSAHEDGSSNAIVSTPDQNKLSSIFLGDGGFESMMKERSRVRAAILPCCILLNFAFSSPCQCTWPPLITNPPPTTRLTFSFLPTAAEKRKRRTFSSPGNDSTHFRRASTRGGNPASHPIHARHSKELHAQNSGDGEKF